MIQQIEVDFTQIQHQENNVESQQHFDDNIDKFSAQCKKVYNALLRGERLTTAKALIDYKIGDLRARIRDLRHLNIPVADVRLPGGYKEYFLASE